MPLASDPPAVVVPLPEYAESDLALAVDRRFDQSDQFRRNEFAVVGAFAGLFVGRRVYDLVDPRDGSPCRGVLRSVAAEAGAETVITVAAENNPAVGRRGPVRVHFAAGLNWTVLSTANRAEVLAVLSYAGRETNAAVAYAAARGLPVLSLRRDPAAGVRPGPVLLDGATVFVPGVPYPVFPVAAKLDTVPAAYEAVRALRRGPAPCHLPAAQAPLNPATPPDAPVSRVPLPPPAAAPVPAPISAGNRTSPRPPAAGGYAFRPRPRISVKI